MCTLPPCAEASRPCVAPDEAATTGELEAAARQYVRKISGYRTPSARNAEAFEAAIAEIAAASSRLLETLGVDVEEGPDRWTPRRRAAISADPRPMRDVATRRRLTRRATLRTRSR